MPIKRIYEDMVARRLSLERFDKFSAQYQETEQKQMRQVTEDKSSEHRRQKIEIYYESAGIIDIADGLCEAGDGRGQWRKAQKRVEQAGL